MNSIELEAGKMELVQAIAGISNPEILAKARKALYRIIHSSAKTEEEEDPMPGGISALQYTREELIELLHRSEEDIKAGRVYTSEEVFRRMEEKFPFLCE